MYKGGVVRGHRMHQRLTKVEKKEIVVLTRQGIKQVEIARRFQVHPSAIQRVQEASGVGRWAQLTPELEQQAVRLAHEGVAVNRIAKATRLRGRDVRAVMAKHKIVHAVGGGPKLPAAKRAAIAEAIRNREDYLYRLADKFRVDRATVTRIAREITGVTKFVGWPGIEPLWPVFSDAQLKAGFEKFLEALLHRGSEELQMRELIHNYIKLVKSHADIWYEGQIPSDHNTFVAELLEAYMPRVKPKFIGILNETEYARERAVVAGYIRQAVECAAGSHWTN